MCSIVAMVTVLAPVSFSFELNITICDSITTERGTYTKHTECPYMYVCLVSSLTIKEWTMLVRPKKSKSHSCKKEEWKLSCCHGNIATCISVCLKVHYRAKFHLQFTKKFTNKLQKKPTMPQYFQRYCRFWDLSTHCNHLWHHH